MNQPSLFDTVLEKPMEVGVEDARDKGFICPCCNLFVKRYKRALVSNAALALLTLYKTGNLGYVHIENL